MKILISPRSAARLAAASAIVVSLAPVMAAAAVTTTATAASPTPLARHAPRTDGLCDGHMWSLFGCRPDHHQVHQPDADELPSAA